ncbi:hypothetical protein ABEB36_007969 [Hypothenemus hampei]|uniref:Uncharacterized protein n=1 Tax=Hypothenemus hampei TaxID=57062 RepID=A0ABD1EKR6_HYPHA
MEEPNPRRAMTLDCDEGETASSGRMTECGLRAALGAEATNHNQRGLKLEDWMSSVGMVVVNTGTAPTFSRGGRESLIDVTMASSKALELACGLAGRER